MKFEKIGNNIISGVSAREISRKVFNFYVGIDPDLDKSGFAVYRKKDKKLIDCVCLSFFDLYDTLRNFQLSPFIVHIEGGWLNDKSNFQNKNVSKAIGEKIAKNVGNNHAVGKLIVEMCIHLDISFVVRKPIHANFENEAYFKKVTGWTGRTNKDTRSAANYVYGY